METDHYDNILIIKMRHLGDVLTTTPLVSAIKEAWPDAGVTYLINPGGEDLVRHHPDVREVLTVPRGRGAWRQITFLHELRKRRFDLAIELSWGDRGAFLARATGAPTRVGYKPKHKKWFDRRRLFTHLVTSRGSSKHTVEFHLDALRQIGLEPGFQPLALHWPGPAAEKIRNRLQKAGIDPKGPYAVVHPSSRWMFKTWRADGNAKVIDFLQKRGRPVVVSAAPAQKELDFVQEVLALTKSRPLDLSGKLDLSELAALIGGADLFFGVDSLPMHMAAAVGTPAVALFGPSGEHMWSPWGPGHQVVAKDWKCRPCGRDGCNGSKVSRCLVEISSGEVFPALERVMEKTRA